MKNLSKIDILYILIIFALTLISRLSFSTAAGNYFGIDPSLFALGATDYSIIDNRPHLPGYILHIQSIKLLSSITGDHSISMVWLSRLYSLLAAIFVYLIFRKWFNSRLSLLYSLLLITNPLVWFYGCVPEIYAFDLFFGSAIVLCGLSGRMIFLTPVLAALGAGVRQSSGVLILPIYLILWAVYYKQYKPNIRYIIIVHIIGAGLILSWFIPMVNSVGGLKEYIDLYGKHGRIAAIVGVRKFITNQISLVSLSYTVFLPIIYPIFKWFYTRNRKRPQDSDFKMINDKPLLKICLWWVVPILIFFIFYHYNKGYLLIILPGILLLMAYIIRRTNISVMYIYLIIALQIAMFLFFPYAKASDEVLLSSEQRSMGKFDVWLERLQGPYSMSYGSIRETNEGLKRVRSGISFCDGLTNDGKYTGYFVSSTAQVIPTTLHVLYPQINIYYHYRGSGDKFSRFFSMVSTKKQGLADMIEHAVVITSGSFFEKYLSGLCKPIYRNGDIAFSVIIKGQQENFSKLYIELF